MDTLVKCSKNNVLNEFKNKSGLYTYIMKPCQFFL